LAHIETDLSKKELEHYSRQIVLANNWRYMRYTDEITIVPNVGGG